MLRRSLLVLLCAAFMGAALAVRRSDDDGAGGAYDDAPPAAHHESYTTPNTDGSSPDGAGGSALPQGGSEDPDVPKQSFLTGLIPVFAIMFVSKSIPAFDTGGSSIPMLIAVLSYPNIMGPAANAIGINWKELPELQQGLFQGLCAVLTFTTIVNTGKMFGMFKPAGEAQVGSPAEPLTSLTYVQGTPVDVQRSGSVKVVEFWATWCGPCKTAIPHLNTTWKKLVKEFGDDKIQFVGVSNENEEKVKKFIAEDMAGKMEYPVALDTGAVGKAYPTKGIPHAYIVGKDGNIAWSGHPGNGLEVQVRKALAAEAAAMPGVSIPAAGLAAEQKSAPAVPKAAPKKAEVVD